MSRRQLIVLWYLFGTFFVVLGAVQLVSASGVSRWIGGYAELVGGVLILTGAVIGCVNPIWPHLLL
jgi:uncharacterized membrane protein HdeD (DUF308 family)